MKKLSMVDARPCAHGSLHTASPLIKTISTWNWYSAETELWKLKLKSAIKHPYKSFSIAGRDRLSRLCRCLMAWDMFSLFKRPCMRLCIVHALRKQLKQQKIVLLIWMLVLFLHNCDCYCNRTTGGPTRRERPNFELVRCLSGPVHPE
jgi:hypothetical protein